MRWQCAIVDIDGNRCPEEATKRVFYSEIDPFSFTDICDKHYADLKAFYAYFQDDLQNYGESK